MIRDSLHNLLSLSSCMFLSCLPMGCTSCVKNANNIHGMIGKYICDGGSEMQIYFAALVQALFFKLQCKNNKSFKYT